MYTYCLILRWDGFKQSYCVYFIYCIFWFIFLVFKFEKEKKNLSKNDLYSFVKADKTVARLQRIVTLSW